MKYPENEETFEMKADICMSIITSEWMDIHRELDVVDLHDKAIYEELQQSYPKIYAEYSSKRGFANLYRLRNITAKDDESLGRDSYEMETFELQEYVFSCLARNRKSKKIEQYFISQEYDLEKCTAKNIVPIIIRFLFTFKDEKRGIIPVALTDDRLDNYRLEPEK